MVEKAIAFLKTTGYEKIGTYGISLGSVLAFMSEIIFDEISCVIGVSPTCIIPEGFADIKKVTGKSFLTFRGKEIPFTFLENDIPNYERLQNAYSQLHEKFATIPIEKIKGRILLLAGNMDELWNSVLSVNLLKQRLIENKFIYPNKICIYDGSHYMGIIPHMKKHKSLNLIKILSKVERRHKKQCQIARVQSEKEIINWLSEW